MTTEELAKIRADYEAAREMREFSAAKRINFEDYGEGLTADRWFVVKGKDTSCFGEGTPNHWRWAAMILLGLASPDDAPHAEEKPTPEIVPMLLDEIERLRADAARPHPDSLRLDKLQAWHRAMTDVHYDQGDKFEELFDDESLSIRDAIDAAAGEDATWLAKGETK